jgi:hypothetical protein
VPTSSRIGGQEFAARFCPHAGKDDVSRVGLFGVSCAARSFSATESRA